MQYSLGSKNWSGDPAALFQVLDSPDQKFITVSSNYRLGSPGWVSGPGLDMVPNAGLWDGIASVEWTKKYISNFGGDPDQITVMGESSGGGIINHMITAWDGEGRTPFQQVRVIHMNIPCTRLTGTGRFDFDRLYTAYRQWIKDDLPLRKPDWIHELHYSIMSSKPP